MTAEENRRLPPSTEVSPRETEVDPQLSACADDGVRDGPLPQGPPDRRAAERRQNAPRRAQARTSSGTPRLAAGELLGGRYRIERELGEGGMGVVYLAADEQVPGERFAVKILKEQLHPEALTLLREEVRKTRKLSHPNIVDVHSVNVDGAKLYVLMEYLEGKPLNALLDEEFGRGMSFSHAWPIIEDVGAALGNAHDHNVIHSDLKPANVFVTTSGRTKLLDFGIARVSRGPLLRAPCGGRALTPAYASCELLQGKEADRRDDIYSFACVIYEMLCGERPFGELSALQARDAAVQPTPLQGLSRGQNAALAKALAFDREARTGTVESLLAGLAAGTKPRPRPVALLGAAILAALAAVGLTYFALDRPWGSPRSVVVEAVNTQQAASPATAPGTAAFNPPPHSIAVLPFVNISGDKEQEYFSDGLSEELIDHLVHSADLKVIARTSSFQFKGRNEDVRSIALKLGVAYVLEGSVRKEGEQLRITAQLIRAADGVHLWSQSYDRNLVAIFTLQDEIADKVSQALRVALPSGHRAGNREPDIRAYNLVLEGDYLKTRRTPGDVERAAQLYQQAIDIDPDYALAWARLASAYLSEEILKGPPTAEQNRRILQALERAIGLDPKLVWAYYTRGGFELNVAWDWAAAQADTERMRAIDPRSALLPSAYGDIAMTFGEVERAVEWYQQDVERSPLDPNTLDSLGAALCAANRLQQCLQTRLRALQLHPEFDGINGAVGIARLYLGQFDAALAALQREANEDYRLRGLAMVYAGLGRREAADAALNSLTGKFAATDAYGIAAVHAYRGEVDDAFRWLDRAYRQHDPGMLELKADPLLRKLRGDRRFQALLTRMRLTGQKQAVNADVRT